MDITPKAVQRPKAMFTTTEGYSATQHIPVTREKNATGKIQKNESTINLAVAIGQYFMRDKTVPRGFGFNSFFF